MLLLKPEEMREMDQRVIDAGFPDLLLMETAGRGVADIARSMISPGQSVLVIAGKGNNGGDGLVAARFLDMWGIKTKVILTASPDDLKGSPEVNYRVCSLRNIPVYSVSPSHEIEEDIIKDSDLIIDALLGTGIKGEVREPYRSIINIINKSHKKVLAVDIPSGIEGKTGKVLGTAVRANTTATMAFPKLGLLMYPGREYAGQVEIIDLGFPREFIYEKEYKHHVLLEEEAAALIPPRQRTGHKGTFGKVGVIGGSRGMAGAPSMTGKAALVTGAGLVRIAVPEEIQFIVSSFSPELITTEYGDLQQFNDLDQIKNIKKLLEISDVMALGPGLGTSKGKKRLVEEILLNFNGPLVLDADGLNVIDDLQVFKTRKAPLVITPHPGEMARLLGTTIQEIQEDRPGVARNIASENNIYVILKGAVTVIALPDGTVYLNPTGNEGMATGGSGDVLTGIISGLLAQGLRMEKAVILAPYLHGLAGDLALEDVGSFSLIATTIIDYLPAAFEKLVKKGE